MMIVAGEVRFGEGEIERLRPLLRAAIEGSRGDDGCLSYSYGIDALEPNRLLISERWRDEAAVDAHFKQAHITNLIEAVMAAKVEAISVRMYGGDYVRTLLGD